MKVSDDAEVDALTIRLDDGRVADSEMVSPGVVVAYDSNDRIIGVEILSVMKREMPIDVPDLGTAAAIAGPPAQVLGLSQQSVTSLEDSSRDVRARP